MCTRDVESLKVRRAIHSGPDGIIQVMAKLIAHIDPALEDYIEAAARTEGVPMGEYAGALIQVGLDVVFGVLRSDRLPRAAAASGPG